MIETYSPSPTLVLSRRSADSLGLPQRLIAIAGILALELTAFSAWLDSRAFQGAGKGVMHGLIAFSAFFLTFGFLRSRAALEKISGQLAGTPVKWMLLAAHFGAAGALALCGAVLDVDQGWKYRAAVAVFGSSAVLSAAISFIPVASWIAILKSTGNAWAYATGATVVAVEVTLNSGTLWKPVTSLTFRLVQMVLRPFLPDMIADPATATIGTHQFLATVAPACSGIEGVGLILIFTIFWLWFFREECRFPQALVLIPAGVVVLWSLNVLRIAVLILIGNAGMQNVAVGGFHSQAGWIAFNAVALGMCLTVQRVPWFTKRVRERAAVEQGSYDNPTTAYLIPFLAILAAGMISRAASGSFEWLYPLRFIAAAGALYFAWPRVSKLDWKFGWLGPVTGAAIFALWLGLDMYNGVQKSGMPETLAGYSESGRIVWLVFRVLAGVVTVPIAEELAFRGFLLRRLISADFESVSTRAFTVVSIVVSSIAFGLLHGDRWIAGTIAGAAYAGVMLWRGRIGDAVIAHGVSNLLIAVWVLGLGNWQLW